MVRCADCDSENREGARFCDACGAKIEPESMKAEPAFDRMDTGEESPAASTGEDGGVIDWTNEEDAGTEGATDDPEDSPDSMEAAGEAPMDLPSEPEAEPDSTEPEAEAREDSLGWPEETPESEGTDEGGSTDAAEAEAAGAAEAPKAGYLVFPDSTEQPIPPSQWLLGRADLAKFLVDPDKANEISRGHVTVYQDGESFFVEDGKTMVQDKPSANKTWLVRGGSRILVTGTGRNELQDADEIDIAELVRLQFVLK